MHGPNAAPHGGGRGCKPSRTSPPGRGTHPGREVERCVGGERGDQDRQRHKYGIVRGRGLVIYFHQMVMEIRGKFTLGRIAAAESRPGRPRSVAPCRQIQAGSSCRGLFPPYLPLGILNRTRPVLDQAPCTDQPEGIVPLTHRPSNWASRPPIAPRSQLRRNIQNETARQAARRARYVHCIRLRLAFVQQPRSPFGSPRRRAKFSEKFGHNDPGGVAMLKGSVGLIALSSLLMSGAAFAQEKIKVGVTATLEGTYTVLGEDGMRGFRRARTSSARRSATRNSNSSSPPPTRRPTPRCAPFAS